MSSFGLGIVLNFVDNATAGMNNATNTFLNMSNTIQGAAGSTSTAIQQVAQGTVLNTLGTSLTNFGNSMTNVVKNVLNNVNTVGSEFKAFNVTLSQLYGSSEAAEAQIHKLMNFSIHSPFEVADTKDMLVVLKSQGIEAFDSIKGSITGVEQETLNWISDLMAFKPDVPMQKWRLALQNYIGSGEQRNLRNILDMGKIDEILGHDIGETTEARLNDIIEIVEKKNLQGLTQSMMETPTAYLSNIADYFTMFYKAIGDAGVFDNLFDMLKSVTTLLGQFDYESGNLPKVAQIVADGFNILLVPLKAVTEGVTNLIGSFMNFAVANPALGKLAVVLFGVAGASTVALGWILRISGSILTLAGSIKLLGGLSNIFATIRSGIGLLGGKLLWAIPLGILMYQAWKNNFLGIQDVVSNTSEKLNLLWSYFSQGYFTDEQWDLANQLGIIPLIEKLEVMKYYWDYFKQGFGAGFNEFFDSFYEGLDKVVKKIKEFFGIDLKEIFKPITDFFSDALGIGLEDTYTKIGNVVGKIAGIAVVLLPLLKVIKAFSKVGGVVGGLLGLGKGKTTGGSGGITASPASMAKSMANLAIMLTSMAAIATVVGLFASIPGDLLMKGSQGILALSVAMIPLSSPIFNNMINTLQRLARFKPTTILKGVGNLAIIMTALSAISAVCLLIMSIPAMSMDVGKMLGLVLVITAIGLVGSAMSALAGLIGAIPITAVLLGLANIAIALTALTALAVGLNLVTKLNLNYSAIMELVKIITAVGLVGSALAALSAIIGMIPILAVLSGIANITLVLGALVGITAILSNLSDKMSAIQKGGEVLSTLCYILGDALGSLVGGALAGISSGLPDIGANIASFIQNLQPAIDIANSGNASNLGTFFKELSVGLLAFTATDLLSGLTGGVDLSALGSQLSGFMSSASGFFSAAASVPVEGIEKAKQVFQALQEINDGAFKSGGVAQWWFGEIDLSVFNELGNNVGGLVNFCNQISAVPVEGIEKAKQVFQALQEINDGAFKSGGVAQWWLGEIDLSCFQQLGQHVGSVVQFFNAITPIDTSAFEKAKLMFQALQEINNAAFKSGGVDQWWRGEIDLSNLGTQLNNFATNAGQFFTRIGALPPESGATITSLFTSLKSCNTIAEYDLSSLPQKGTDLSNFATNFKGFVDNINVIDTATLMTKVTEISTACSQLSSIVVPAFTDVSSSITNVVNSVTQIASTITTVGQQFPPFAQTAKQSFTDVSTGANDLVTTMSQASSSIATAMQTMASAVVSACRQAISALSQLESKGYSAGYNLMSRVAAGINSGSGLIQSAINRALSSVSVDTSKIKITGGRVPAAAKGVDNFVGGLIQVNEKGGELIDLPSGSRVIPHDQSIHEALKDGIAMGAKAMSSYASQTQLSNSKIAESSQDNRVIFSKGSIVITTVGATQAEMEKAAEFIMKYIERKQKLRSLAVRV